MLPIAARAQGAAKPADAAAPEGMRVLEARKSPHRIKPGAASETDMWGYDGQVPGPLLHAKVGEEVVVRLLNKLDQPTSLHWQGVRIQNAMDGVVGLTQKPVMSGAVFDYRFKVPDSGLYLYRPFVAPFTSEQIARGLYGLLIVDEPSPPQVDRDFALLIDDWRLDEQGMLVKDFGNPADVGGAGRIGSLLTANTQAAPIQETFAPGSRIRLRLANVANARFMFIAFEGFKPFVMAIDGQPCDPFEPVRQTIPVGPGARFDLMFDLPDGESESAKVVLRGMNEADRDLCVLKTKGEKRPARLAIASLPLNPLLPAGIPLAAAKKVDIVVEGGSARVAAGAKTLWTLNGQPGGFDGKPLFSVKRGASVSLGFVNKTLVTQNMRVHGHVVRLLHDLDDGWEPYWRNAVIVAEGRTKRVAFVADNPGKWAINCDVIEHQISGLSGWFEVT
ncbi:MAG: multicopper oxidase family protein [Methylobacteriaceae bacterium]|nr:multicopper oxidase family protein [Methylobacteriaceae bacterium]